jgi:NAD-dependent deacetylase
METINPFDYKHVAFFTGAGMSAESGVPTYRGCGGIWDKYHWEEYACQEAFDRNAMKVLQFHELRRKTILKCHPHSGHFTIADLEKRHPHVITVTQNIDGMHQRGGSKNVIEIHGSLWRMRCAIHGILDDIGENYISYTCSQCGSFLRPDITWFGDMLNQEIIQKAVSAIVQADIFISIGTSGVVWPAAGFPQIAKDAGALCIEINPESSLLSNIYDITIRSSASAGLEKLFYVSN